MHWEERRRPPSCRRHHRLPVNQAAVVVHFPCCYGVPALMSGEASQCVWQSLGREYLPLSWSCSCRFGPWDSLREQAAATSDFAQQFVVRRGGAPHMSAALLRPLKTLGQEGEDSPFDDLPGLAKCANPPTSAREADHTIFRYVLLEDLGSGAFSTVKRCSAPHLPPPLKRCCRAIAHPGCHCQVSPQGLWDRICHQDY